MGFFVSGIGDSSAVQNNFCFRHHFPPYKQITMAQLEGPPEALTGAGSSNHASRTSALR